MSSFIKEILSMSLSGSLLILLLFVMKPLLKESFSKAWQYYIWIIVLIRLLVPFSPEFGLLDNLFQVVAVEDNASPSSHTDTPSVHTEGNSVANTSNGSENNDNLSVTKPVNPVNYLNGWELGSYLWLAGAIILFLIKMIRYLRFVHLIQSSAEPIVDNRILKIYKRVAEELGIKKKPQLFFNGQIASPMVIGLLKPIIYLTDISIEWDDISLYYVLRHELMHYKRHDLWYKWSCDLTLCIHWFNPMIYMMNRQINSQCEISCDEAVARDLSVDEKLMYGNVLLNAVSENIKSHHQVLYSTLYEDKKSIKERIKSIIMSKRKPKKVIILSVIVTILLIIAAYWLGTYTMKDRNSNNNTVATGNEQNSTDDSNTSDNTSDNQLNSGEEIQSSDVDGQSNEEEIQSGDDNLQSDDVNSQGSDTNAEPTTVSTDESAEGTFSPAESENDSSNNPPKIAPSKSEEAAATSQSGNSSFSQGDTIVYTDTDFGFDFTLPASWDGYSVQEETWQGTALSGKHAGEVTESGTKIIIRHPDWTKDNPRQDIPILVFTKEQWDKIEKEDLAIGAAPIGPSKLGNNSKYIFALPARYNFAFATGYEEVEKIIESTPLIGSENFK